MTKLRRLDPQPADLTTHKGPFVDLDGKPATLLAGNLRNAEYKPCLWSIEHTHITELTQTEKSGRNIIFAAEEIHEPRVIYMNDYGHGLHGPFGDREEADDDAIGATSRIAVRRFVEDTSYGGNV